jgi:hypothetical protein
MNNVQMENEKKRHNLIADFCAMVFIFFITIGIIIFFLIYWSNFEIKFDGGFIFALSIPIIFILILIYACIIFWKKFFKYRNKQPNVESQPLIGPFPNNPGLDYPPIVSKNLSKNLSKNVNIHVDNPSLTLNKI